VAERREGQEHRELARAVRALQGDAALRRDVAAIGEREAEG
jgi:hypothetical protein